MSIAAVGKTDSTAIEAQLNELLKSPDFAMPRDVMKSSAKAMQIALDNDKPKETLQAVIELTIAQNAITSDSTEHIYKMLEELPDKLHSPYSELACLLEAKFLSQMYNHNRYSFDRRQLPLQQLSSNPMEWSGAQFKREISRLCNLSLRNEKITSSVSADELDGLITVPSNPVCKGLSVYDFIVYEVLDSDANLNIDERRSLVSNLVRNDERRSIDSDEVCDGALLLARINELKYSSSENRQALIDGIIKDYSDTPVYPISLCSIYSISYGEMGPDEKQTFYRVISDASEKAGTAGGKNSAGYKSLNYIRQQIASRSVSLRCESQVLVGKPISVGWSSTSAEDFYILLVKVPSGYNNELLNYESSLNMQRIKSEGTVVASEKVSIKSSIPFQEEGETTLNGVASGYYALVVSEGPTLSSLNKELIKDFCTINVCDISYLTMSSGNKSFITIISGVNGAPVEGASVEVYDMKGSHKLMSKSVTDSKGCVEIPSSPTVVNVHSDKNQLSVRHYGYGYGVSYPDTLYNAEILTDLAIYHPGDSVRCVNVLVSCDANIVRPVAGAKMTAKLLDANYKDVGQSEVTTDISGRCEAFFQLPENGMTGMFSIQAIYNNKVVGMATFQVADYKAPTMWTLLEKPTIDEKDMTDDCVILKGNVSSYSGMPISDCNVVVEIEFHPWYRFGYPAEIKNIRLECQTDLSGNYEVSVGKNSLTDIDARYGVFYATASATSPAGETQDSERVAFSIGEHYQLSADIRERIEITAGEEDVSLPVKVTDAIGNPVEREVDYRIECTFGSNVEIKGKFKSGILKLPASSLPSGEYKMTFIISQPVDDKGVITRDTLLSRTIVWRASDKTAPSSEAVWSPRKIVYAAPGADKVAISVGNAYPDGYIYMIVSPSTDKGTIGLKPDDIQILKIDGMMRQIEVDAPSGGQRLRVELAGMHDLRGARYTVEVRPADENIKMSIIPETFRDRLTPGGVENWSFKVICDCEGVRYPAVMAVMSNRALNAITPFNWEFTPLSLRHYSYPLSYCICNRETSNMYVTLSRQTKYVSPLTYSVPEWNFYNMPLFSEYGTYSIMRKNSNIRIRGSHPIADMAEMKATSAVMMSYAAGSDDSLAVEESEAEVLMDSVVTADGGNVAKSETDVAMRDMECPLAFFRPSLTGEVDGVVRLSFDVPSFNTEWQLQLIGYNPENMYSANLVLNAVASKPVMIQTNPPRFLRTGDRSVIEALVMNNTDGELTVSSKLEIFDISTGEVLAHHNYKSLNMPAYSTSKVSIEYDVPDNVGIIGLRAVVNSEEGSDGEQTAVPILPSSQPVFDSETWYMDADSTSLSIDIPTLNREASVTLEYCDNPVWYTLMSLNGLLNPDGSSAMMLADAVYSNAVGAGILKRNPVLCSALERIFHSPDSTVMTSPLTLNGNVKIDEINATPWLNNAEAETERMRNIVSLTQQTQVSSVIASLIHRLGELQNENGGWSWCAGMPASTFITEEVLWRFAAMLTAGDLPDGAESMIKRGVGYCDSEMERQWLEAQRDKRRYVPGYSDVEYFYIRDRFNIPQSRIISTIKSDVIGIIKKDWKSYDVTMKCVAAMMLYENGDVGTAIKIMESVQQFASSSPTKGEWFDGATGGLSRTSPVLSSAVALMAFRKIMPEASDIAGLRQYLLLSRQTQDWQMSLSSAKVIIVAQAVLSDSDTDNAITGNRATIKIAGKEIDLSEYADIPGSLVINLNPAEVSGKKLEIERPGGVPAWGGIISAYIAPFKDIKPRSMEQLKIVKALYPVLTDSIHTSVGNASDRFAKGERVRVTLTLATDRDLDYLQIRDDRGAWMEPREQLTGFRNEDGVWYVLEQRTSYTNIYIYHLPKGIHILSYEVTADRDGYYSSGTATAQSQYYPLITARSGITQVTVTSY